MRREIRELHFEIREVGDDGTFGGYGSVFDTIDSYRSRIAKGAFAKTLKERASKARLLWQHRSDKPIGKFIELREDDTGLHFVAKLNLNVAQGREAYEHLKHGDLDGMSIGFECIIDEYDSKTNIRTIKEVKLYEISLVTFPANEDATVNEIKSAFDDLTLEQRIQALSFINSLKSPTGNEPPLAVVATTEEQHSAPTEADTRTTEEPQTDSTSQHSLEPLMRAIEDARKAFSSPQK